MNINKLFIVLLLPLVIGLQLSPASTQLEDNQDFTVTVINDQEQTLNLEAEIIGPLAEYLNLQTTRLSLQPGQRQTIQVQAGEPDVAPGFYETQIRFQEQSQNTLDSGIGTSSSLAHRVQYIQPRTGQWASTRLQTSSLSVNTPVQLSLIITNIGTRQLPSAQARIEVLENGQVIHEEDFQTQPIQEVGRVNTQWVPQEPGQYQVRTTYDYAGKQELVEQDIQVGQRDLEIQNIYAQQLDNLTRVDIEVTNTYNQEYPYVQAQIQVNQQTTQTPVLRLQPGQTANLTGFIEQTYTQNPRAEIQISYPPSQLNVQVTLGLVEEEQTNIPIGLVIIGLLIIFIYIAYYFYSTRGGNYE